MKNKKGFTLIEMLIVVAIIAILSGLILSGLNRARMQSRDARRMADIKNIQAQLEVYYNSHNKYPDSLTPTDAKIQPLADSQGNSYVYCVDNPGNAQHYIVGTKNMEQRVAGANDGCDISTYCDDRSDCVPCGTCRCTNSSDWCVSL